MARFGRACRLGPGSHARDGTVGLAAPHAAISPYVVIAMILASSGLTCLLSTNPVARRAFPPAGEPT
jgi:hypothetical protein